MKTSSSSSTGVFVKVRSMILNTCHIVKVKRVKPSIGRDQVSREYVLTLSEEAEPDKRFRNVWLSRDETADLCAVMDIDDMDPPAAKYPISSVDVVKDASDTEDL